MKENKQEDTVQLKLFANRSGECGGGRLETWYHDSKPDYTVYEIAFNTEKVLSTYEHLKKINL